MKRFLDELPGVAAVLMIGIVLGSWLAGTPAMWWVVVALGVLAAGSQIALMLRRSRKPQNAA